MSTQPDLLAINDGLQQLAAIGSGYKAILETFGFSPTVAEQIAAHYLTTLHTQITQGGK